MRARLKLKPGQRGTKKLVSQYGARLICVRYRYDEKQQKRFKTVEIIVEEIPWTPKQKKIDKTAIVDLRIGYGEMELRRKVRSAGGKWNRAKQLWEIAYEQALSLGLENRIQKVKASNTKDKKASNVR